MGFGGTLRFRQIHLDFHTSPDIPGIGAAFDPDEFADVLDRARVNSITCFARCHHGHLYYQSKTNPERIHPHLLRPNLLVEQIEACHKRGIRVPIYITVQWDKYTADLHSDWLCVDGEGRPYGTKPFEAGFYRVLDVYHPEYRAFLKAHVQEVCESMPVDGIFFDICQPRFSHTTRWFSAMSEEGLNPESETDRDAFALSVLRGWQEEMTAFVQKYHPDATIFYNSGHVGPRHKDEANSYTHFELESLPSGGWGYLHFPQAMRYARTLGHDCLGMTGKFHTTWGDFHSFKNPAALQFECFQMLALNAKCSIGDQLLPNGKIDAATYALIGEVYTEVEKREPWCVGAKPVCDIALMTTEEFVLHGDRNPSSVLGAIRMLQELHLNFDIIDSRTDLTPYKLLILPDSIPGSVGLGMRVDRFLEQGGAVIATHKSGIDPETNRFMSNEFGVEYVGEAPFSPDFIVPTERIGASLPRTGHVLYQKGAEVRPLPNADVLAETEVPYFNRTWQHFCSHNHTPSCGELRYPAAVQNANCLYLAHPVFAQYASHAPLWVKVLVRDAVNLLLPNPTFSVGGPSSLIAALNYQPTETRHVLHLLHYIPERRGQKFDIIEDVIPVYEIPVQVRTGTPVTAVRLVPEGVDIPFTTEGDTVSFVVPKVDGYAVVEIAG
jgi:hypothetical protein